jgi:uncharacterized metal-binding protein
MPKKPLPKCASCPGGLKEKACTNPVGGRPSKGCPTLSGKKLAKKAMELYRQEGTFEFAREANKQEGACYIDKEKRPYVLHPVKTRILEIKEFARRMGYEKLGLVFCGGLAREASVVNQMLKGWGFEVVSVMCKVGGVPKEDLGLEEEDKIFQGQFEPMCNPILQALLVNEAKTEFNVLLGLCVGHDSLFFKHAEAPTTVFAVKDRVTGHNPLACIYTPSYYGWLNS